jgi:hypothetical protein
MESESDDDEIRRARRAPPPKRRKTAKPAERLQRQYVAIATRMQDSGDLMLCKAFLNTGDAPKFWYHDGELWLHPFTGGASAVESALQRALVTASVEGRFNIPFTEVTKKHVKALLNVAFNNTAVKDAVAIIKSGGSITAMRTKARKLLATRGGCLDLSGTEARIVRPMPRDAFILCDEVMPVDCPATMEELKAHGCTDLLNVFKAVLSDGWPVFVDIVVRTLNYCFVFFKEVHQGPEEPRSFGFRIVLFCLNMSNRVV